MKEQTDEEVAMSVQRGDKELFGVLIDRYEEKITRYARKFLSHNDDTKDLVQEVFIKAYTNLYSFDGTRRFSPWIYRIAHNEFVNALRKKSKERIFSFDFDTFFVSAPQEEVAEDTVLKRNTARMLEQHLDALPLKYREPLVLYYLEGIEYKEIAEVLQVPISTVGVRLWRGKKILQEVMHHLDISL
ncbi:MAG: RNA polymerase sigma factor [Parcubacteria group bacterium]|nr:RNA polymerase sigma factor [Parcubacteria group bacterium]